MFRFFEQRLPAFVSGPAQRPPNTFWAFCRHYIRGGEWYLALMALLAGSIAVLEVWLFHFLGQMVDWLHANEPAQLLDQGSAHLWALGLAVVVGLPLMMWLHSLTIFQVLMANLPMRVRWQAHRYLLEQSMTFYQDEMAGRIATKVMQTALAVRETVTKLLDVFLFSLVFFIGIVVMSGSMDWRLAVPFLVWLVLYITILCIFVPRLRRVAQKQADARSDMTGRIVDTYTNIATIKLFSHSRREAQYAQDGMERFLHTVYPQMRLATLLNGTLGTLNALLIFSICATGLWLWSQETISAGVIAAALGVVMRLYGMSQWIMWEVFGLFENIGTVQDGMNTLSKPQTLLDRPQAPALKIQKGEIEFRNVNFNYGKSEKVIDGFNLQIRAGEKVGLVGRSGAGKSTLVNLLLRFYDLEGGAILIDGQNIAEVNQESLRQHIGMVTQDTSLLHRSVRENITYGRPDATGEELYTATKRAKAHEFVEQLEDAKGRTGYQAHVGERGVKLSGGQRQRIAIARVLLKDAPILILDEATSALDSEVEMAIQESLNELMANKTVIAIAHRLSTIAALDRLVIMDQGRIVEQGSHRELLEKGGIYAQLWARQSGGFLGEDA